MLSKDIKMTQMTGIEALIKVLQQEDVKYVFGIPGATEVHVMDALEDHPEIKYILALNEVVSAGMAEGYARTSGKVGFLSLHTGPGLAAATPLLSNAYFGGVPLVITAGQQDTRLLSQEPALTDNLVRIAGPFTKWATEILHAEDVPLVMHRAFRVASHPPTGPVFVSLPQDVLTQAADYEYVKGAPSFNQCFPDPESIRLAADLLGQAVNPVMIVEDGVTKNNALQEVVDLAELIGARVYQPWMADVNFPTHHPLYMGDIDISNLKTRDMLTAVDVLVVIGAAFFAQPVRLAQPLVPPCTKIIQIDNNPWQIAKNFPVSSGVEGDIKVAIGELIKALKKGLPSLAKANAKNRADLISGETRNMRLAFAEKAQKERDKTPIAVSRLMTEIRDALKPATLLVDDCWSCSAVLRQTLDLKRPLSYQRSRGGGSIGYGLPGALGVKLASPDKPVVSIVGDGSAMWSIQTLWTAAHYNIPVTFIVCANSIYRQVRRMKHIIMGEKARGRYLGTDLSHPRNDFCKMAEGMGISARRVDRPEQLNKVLTLALASNQPNLVEVIIEDSL
jgi:benzoylformate decarboxylase